MIQPIIAAQITAPAASVTHNAENQAAIHNQSANIMMHEEERQIKETVIRKDEAVFYDQRHDAKEEGRNKYENLYSKKNKKGTMSKSKNEISRINFDIKL